MQAYLEPADGSRPIALDRGVVVIGRDAACQAAYPDHKWMSRRHCCVVNMGTHYVACDLGSTNGVLIDGSRIVGKQRLTHGARLDVAGVVFVARIPSEQAPAADPAGTTVLPRFGLKRKPRGGDPVVPARQPGHRATAGREASADSAGRSNSPSKRSQQRRTQTTSRRTRDEKAARKARRTRDAGSTTVRRTFKEQAPAEQAPSRQAGRSAAEQPPVRKQRQAQASEADLLSAVSYEQNAHNVEVMEIKCEHCKGTFCYINDFPDDDEDEFLIDCEFCQKPITVTPEMVLAAALEAESDLPPVGDWSSVAAGLNWLGHIGIMAVFLVVVHLTMIESAGAIRHGRIAGQTFIPYSQSSPVRSDGDLTGTGLVMVCFLAAPIVLIAGCWTGAQEFLTTIFVGSVVGGILGPALVNLGSFAGPIRAGFAIYAIIALGAIPGLYMMTNAPGRSGIGGPCLASVILLGLTATALFVGCGVRFRSIRAPVEMIGSPSLAAAALALGLLWMVSQFCIVTALRRVAQEMRNEATLQSIDEFLTFSGAFAVLGIVMLAMLAIGETTGKLTDVLWLVVGITAATNIAWLFQRVRFARYAIR